MAIFYLHQLSSPFNLSSFAASHASLFSYHSRVGLRTYVVWALLFLGRWSTVTFSPKKELRDSKPHGVLHTNLLSSSSQLHRPSALRLRPQLIHGLGLREWGMDTIVLTTSKHWNWRSAHHAFKITLFSSFHKFSSRSLAIVKTLPVLTATNTLA